MGSILVFCVAFKQPPLEAIEEFSFAEFCPRLLFRRGGRPILPRLVVMFLRYRLKSAEKSITLLLLLLSS